MTTKALDIWTIYVKGLPPFPDCHCARKWEVKEGKVIETEKLLHSVDLEEIRMKFINMGLVCLSRSPEDDDTVIESWI